MSTYSIKEIFNSTDRHKLYTLFCSPQELAQSILFIRNQNITAINIGKELALYLDEIDDYRYLNIDVYDFAKKLLDKNKAKVGGSANEVIAIYNLGILLEPALMLNPTQLLKEFSKSTSLIIIWENASDQPGFLNWATQQNIYFFNFSEIQFKSLQHAI